MSQTDLAERVASSEGRRFILRWVLWLRVSDQRAGDKVLGWFGKALGREVTATTNERYWKDPGLRRLMATSPVEANEISAAVFEVLRICGRIAHGWAVSTPSFRQDTGWSFAGDTGWRPNARIKVVGLNCAEFELYEHVLKVEPGAGDMPASE